MGGFYRFSKRRFLNILHEYEILMELYTEEKSVQGFGFRDLVTTVGEPTRAGTVVIIVVYSNQTGVEVVA